MQNINIKAITDAQIQIISTFSKKSGSYILPATAPKKDCNFDTKLQSFLTKSAYVGINPPMVDEIATR